MELRVWAAIRAWRAADCRKSIGGAVELRGRQQAAFAGTYAAVARASEVLWSSEGSSSSNSEPDGPVARASEVLWSSEVMAWSRHVE